MALEGLLLSRTIDAILRLSIFPSVRRISNVCDYMKNVFSNFLTFFAALGFTDRQMLHNKILLAIVLTNDYFWLDFITAFIT